MKYKTRHALELKIDGAIEANPHVHDLGCGLLDIRGFAHSGIKPNGKKSAVTSFAMPYEPMPEGGDHDSDIYVNWRDTWPVVTLHVGPDDLL